MSTNFRNSQRLPDYSDTDNFQVCLKLHGRIEHPAFLLFVREVQKHRTAAERLNVFDLMALYKTMMGMQLRDVDRDTLSKLIDEGLIIVTDDGYRLSQLYDEMTERCADGGNSGGNAGNSSDRPEVVILTERQQLIYDTIKSNGRVTAKSLAGTLAGSQRTIEREMDFLKKNGFIRKEGKHNNGIWVTLK